MSTSTRKIPTRYTRANDHDATTIVSGIPGITGWVWTVHEKHNVQSQGIESTHFRAAAAASAAKLAN